MTARRVPLRRRAQLARCAGCRADVLAGYDDAGFLTYADPAPITRTYELLLYLAGRATHELDDGELIERRAAGRMKRAARVTLTDHVCGETLPAWARAPLPPRAGHLLSDFPVDPPF